MVVSGARYWLLVISIFFFIVIQWFVRALQKLKIFVGDAPGVQVIESLSTNLLLITYFLSRMIFHHFFAVPDAFFHSLVISPFIC